MRITKLTLTVLAAVAIIGCSPSPPSSEIDKGVNWALSGLISWRDQSRNLFESYKVTNHYTETRNDGVAHVYDIEADCLVWHSSPMYVDGIFSGAPVCQALPNEAGKVERFKVTFTLMKKGNTWYRQETIR
jgi:hypothetical protein